MRKFDKIGRNTSGVFCGKSRNLCRQLWIIPTVENCAFFPVKKRNFQPTWIYNTGVETTAVETETKLALSTDVTIKLSKTK